MPILYNHPAKLKEALLGKTNDAKYIFFYTEIEWAKSHPINKIQKKLICKKMKNFSNFIFNKKK